MKRRIHRREESDLLLLAVLCDAELFLTQIWNVDSISGGCYDWNSNEVCISLQTLDFLRVIL